MLYILPKSICLCNYESLLPDHTLSAVALPLATHHAPYLASLFAKQLVAVWSECRKISCKDAGSDCAVAMLDVGHLLT